MPWATWYENTVGAGFGQNNIFASRFDVAQNKWIFAGQSRGTGGVGTVAVPSLNIHTDQSAENPSVAGGSAADATKPGPWVTWQETTNAPVGGKDQIFVSRPLGPGQVNCDGVTPAGVADGTGHVPAIGGFCFQQTGIGRVGPGSADPTLNVDPTRNGVEPDIAFTGKNTAGVQDGVPWVVWYEKDPTNNGISGLTHNNEMVFAAKGLVDAAAGHGGFSWTAVGMRTARSSTPVARTTSAGASVGRRRGRLLAEQEPERRRRGSARGIGHDEPRERHRPVGRVGRVGERGQADLRLAACQRHALRTRQQWGTDLGRRQQLDPSRHHVLGQYPYVTWRENNGGGVEKAFVGHFVNPRTRRSSSTRATCR